jgi:hypothetical protein
MPVGVAVGPGSGSPVEGEGDGRTCRVEPGSVDICHTWEGPGGLWVLPGMDRGREGLPGERLHGQG